MSRLRSDIYVDALKKITEQEGGFFYVARKGEPSAGAIFILMYDVVGNHSLYVPVSNQTNERNFSLSIENASEQKCRQKITSEINFDSDLWLIEIQHKHICELAKKLNLTLPAVA